MSGSAKSALPIRRFNILVPILISIHALSLAGSILTLLPIFLQETMPWLTLLVLVFLISLESSITTRWLAHPERIGLNKTYYRLSEWIILILSTRLFTWLIQGSWPSAQRLLESLRYPDLLFADNFFLIGLGLSGLAWLRSQQLASLIAAIALHPAEIAYFSLTPHQREKANKPILVSRGPAIRTLIHHWSGWAVFLVGLSSLAVIEGANSSSGRLLPPGIILGLLGYFFSGFILFSQARLLFLHARWTLSDTQTPAEINRVWQRNSLRILVIMALAAAFLPLGPTFTLNRILSFLILIVTWIVTAVTALFILLLSLLAIPFVNNEPVTPLPFPTPAPIPTPDPAGTAVSSASGLIGILTSSLFWAVALVAVVTAVSFYIRSRGWQLQFKPLIIRDWWKHFKSWLVVLLSKPVFPKSKPKWNALWQRSPTVLSFPRSFSRRWTAIRLSTLSPRDQIKYYYLSTIRWIQKKGIPRSPGATPLEIARNVAETWPDTSQEFERLTEIFIRAQYTPYPIAPQILEEMKQQRRQIKSQLRRIKTGDRYSDQPSASGIFGHDRSHHPPNENAHNNPE